MYSLSVCHSGLVGSFTAIRLAPWLMGRRIRAVINSLCTSLPINKNACRCYKVYRCDSFNYELNCPRIRLEHYERINWKRVQKYERAEKVPPRIVCMSMKKTGYRHNHELSFLGEMKTLFAWKKTKQGQYEDSFQPFPKIPIGKFLTCVGHCEERAKNLIPHQSAPSTVTEDKHDELKYELKAAMLRIT